MYGEAKAVVGGCAAVPELKRKGHWQMGNLSL